jgi:diguanylate cyclase (GGDEF)-like protein/putative nucleotidyltransferase with HDIG domain
VYWSPAVQSAPIEETVRGAAGAAACFAGYHVTSAVLHLLAGRFDFRRLPRVPFWTLPYYLLAGALTGLYTTKQATLGWQTGLVSLPLVFLLYHAYRVHLARVQSQRRHADSMSGLLMRTIETLALAIGSRDHGMESHLRRVQVYAREIGHALKLTAPEMQALDAASLLHDIGKLAVPDHIISKPGRLTAEEFEKMKIHPIVGAEILSRVKFPFPVVPYVRHHHERWDGTGYPDGLKGEEIPIGARILAVVDTLDALASDRQYRRALPLTEAVDYIAKEAGRSFDPRIAQVLQTRYREFESVANQELERTRERETSGVRPGVSRHRFSEVVNSISAASGEVRVLFELTREIGNSLDLNQTFNLLPAMLKQLIPCPALVIYLKRRDMLHPRHVHGPNVPLSGLPDLLLGSGASAIALTKGSAVVNGHPLDECPSGPARPFFEQFRSALAVPLIGTDSVIGALTLYHHDADAFSRDTLRKVEALAPKLSQAIENGIRFEQAEDRATSDHLTGLPNAHSLFLHLERELVLARYANTPLGVAVCDLNGFKMVNDTLGHLAGNQLLQAVAAGLKDHCREYDFVARMGGDEFVVILSGAQPPVVRARVRQMRAVIEQAAQRTCPGSSVRASFGTAVYPADGDTADQLLAVADREMFRDKHQSRRRELGSGAWPVELPREKTGTLQQRAVPVKPQ